VRLEALKERIQSLAELSIAGRFFPKRLGFAIGGIVARGGIGAGIEWRLSDVESLLERRIGPARQDPLRPVASVRFLASEQRSLKLLDAELATIEGLSGEQIIDPHCNCTPKRIRGGGGEQRPPAKR
jgi:hypothetical protein